MSRGKKPTVIHIGGNDPFGEKGSPYLCGQPYEQIADKYLTDAFYRTLPSCEECLAKSNGKQRAEWIPVPTGGLFDIANSNTPQSPPLVDDEEESEVVSTSLEWWANKAKEVKQ
jgi:hypothetical protein